MISIKHIGECMSPHIHTIGADQSLESAKTQMYKHNIKHLPVLKGGKLFGILSDRDIKLTYAVDGSNAKSLKVEDACIDDVYCTQRETPLKEVTKVMATKGLGCCIITKDDNTVEGIFTVTDACRVLSEFS